MTRWTSEDLTRIGKADELRIATRRGDDTLRKPVTIWVVSVADDLYVRAVNGRTGLWFRHAQERHAGQITAGGVRKDVTFVEVGEVAALNDQIDAAYASKYSYSPSAVSDVTKAAARAATIRLVPR
jgi:hypothetical protein